MFSVQVVAHSVSERDGDAREPLFQEDRRRGGGGGVEDVPGNAQMQQLIQQVSAEPCDSST